MKLIIYLALMVAIRVGALEALEPARGSAPPAAGASVVLGGRVRLTVLTPRLVRAEWSDAGAFDDAQTFAAVARALLPVPRFSVSNSSGGGPGGETVFVLSTDAMNVTFVDRGRPAPAPARACARRFADAAPTGGVMLAARNVSGEAACCDMCAAAAPGCDAWGLTVRGGGPGGLCEVFGGGVVEVRDKAAPGRHGAFVAGLMGEPASPFGAGVLTVQLASGGPPASPGGAPNAAQLNGTFTELGCYVNPVACVDQYWSIRMRLGLVARSGAVFIDDSFTPRLVDGAPLGAVVPLWHAPAAADEADVYISAYESDYVDFLRDWTRVSGAIAMPRRSALGVWYGRYEVESDADELAVLQAYADLALPLAGLMADMNWHITPSGPVCASYGQYEWNTTLFRDPIAFASALHSGATPLGRPLGLSLNVHPQSGLDPCDRSYAAFAARMGVDPATNATVPCDVGNLTFSRALWELVLSRAELRPTDWMWTDCM